MRAAQVGCSLGKVLEPHFPLVLGRTHGLAVSLRDPDDLTVGQSRKEHSSVDQASHSLQAGLGLTS